jgi:hypothetical protein
MTCRWWDTSFCGCPTSSVSSSQPPTQGLADQPQECRRRDKAPTKRVCTNTKIHQSRSIRMLPEIQRSYSEYAAPEKDTERRLPMEVSSTWHSCTPFRAARAAINAISPTGHRRQHPRGDAKVLNHGPIGLESWPGRWGVGPGVVLSLPPQMRAWRCLLEAVT